MKPIRLYLICAVFAYLFGGLNPAIMLSKLIYHRDIRTLGSGNPGFTNFKRTFGGRYAWFVFLLDISKGALLCLIFCPLFEKIVGSYQLGAAFTGVFAMLGHSFPVWYRFRGGKGFLVGATTIFFIDWRVGLIAAAVMLSLLFTVKYMSLSVIVAAAICPIGLIIFGVDSPAVVWLCLSAVCLMIARHAPNIRRLINGNESKFHLFDKSDKKTRNN